MSQTKRIHQMSEKITEDRVEAVGNVTSEQEKEKLRKESTFAQW